MLAGTKRNYICSDKFSIHPLKTIGKGIHYVGEITHQIGTKMAHREEEP